MKRKLDSTETDSSKRLKLSPDEDATTTAAQVDSKSNLKVRKRINKLVPPRPFPTVPTSVSATGPRSSHREGKNLICITRKTPLAAYLRRCKDVVIKDGYKTLHFSALGAAIPHLLQLVCALPPILPFEPEEFHQEITTGTVRVHDEVSPDDDDDDLIYQTRDKSTLSVILKIGDGEFEGEQSAIRRYSAGKGLQPKHAPKPPTGTGKNIKSSNTKGKQKEREVTIMEEPEQEFMDTL